MTNERELYEGLVFITGTWRAEYLVSALSDDLAHIPAAEFKSEDGADFSAISFTFFEDHTVVMEDTAGGKRESGVWEQTGPGEYRYTLGGFFELPDGAFRKNAETLTVRDGRLVFSIGFLAVAMKKTADGAVSPEKNPDAAKQAPDGGEAAPNWLVGVWKVERTMALLGGDFRFCARGEVEADLDARGADEEERREALQPFDAVIEFTADRRVLTRVKVPEGLSGEELSAALAAGEISDLRDGAFTVGETAWKTADGRCFYDTGESREVCGEEQSSWDELTPDGEGLLPFGSGMMMLKKI
ncbi:MAG: hypothetical protein IJR89_06015 [Clostridia bacterium]|nr:hypothetical protein [Clostridia bacterium]